ncbi:MlaD family protein [Methylotenera sp.]|uniref:PqiB family protein n=1 Tax=Methylotenera sp. TaxID=2051956 RepID=UPI002486E70C|nr:MlaD family protein [Methylotenera sp.]MDI1299822.1 MlaD family protein [Methylotenera sp.]
MSEEITQENVAGLPTPKREQQRKWLPSLVWLIPIIAAIIGIVLVAKILIDRGPVITITFRTGEGLEAGKTRVKYKEVDIGEVQTISLSKDRSQVQVKVQLAKNAESFTTMDTHYWVVRPRLGASGISGLGTLLSGAYIAADGGVSEETTKEFTGLEVQPTVTRDDSGKQFMLHADDLGSVDVGSPIFYRRVKVGRVSAYDLDEDGKGVSLRIFIDKPYDKFVGVNTRFWHASGVDIQVNASGFKVNTQSLASVVLGGLAFQSADGNPGALSKENTTFLLAQDQADALKAPDGDPETVILHFNQSVRGLTPGATVDFRGVELGQVKSVGIEYDAKLEQFNMPVVIEIYPARLGSKYVKDQAQSPYTQQQRIQFMISRGLRAQLRTGNLLTGQLYVALDFFPKATPVVQASSTPIELPTIPNGLDELQTQIATITSKLSKVPFDQIGVDLQKSLVTLNHTLNSAEKLTQTLNQDVAPEVTAAMKDVRKTLDSAQHTLSEDAPLQQDLRQTLQDLSRAASSLKVLTDYLEQHPESLIRGKAIDNP